MNIQMDDDAARILDKDGWVIRGVVTGNHKNDLLSWVSAHIYREVNVRLRGRANLIRHIKEHSR